MSSSEGLYSTSITYRVPYADTDQMGMVYHANFLVYFERTRNELLREMGLPYTAIEAAGVLLPVLEANCHYLLPARYDDLLTLSATLAEIKGPRLRITNEVRNAEGQLLGHGYTVHAFMAATTRRPIRAPAIFTEALAKAQLRQA